MEISPRQTMTAAGMGAFAAGLVAVAMDWETLGGVLLVTLPPLVVSVAIDWGFQKMAATSAGRRWVFVIPAPFWLAIVGYPIWSNVFGAPDAASDGTRDMSLFLCSAYVAAVIVASLCLAAKSLWAWCVRCVGYVLHGRY